MYDLIILGGGTAGLGCAVYAARFQLRTLVLSRDYMGTISKTHVVENYPGTVSVSGMDLQKSFLKHVDSYGVERKEEEITDIEKKDGAFLVKTNKGEYEGKTILFALGSTRRKLNVPGEKEFENKGISYCATCLPPSENVVGNNEVIEISAIKEEDRVLTIDGSFERVLATTNRNYDGDLLEIKTRMFTEPTLLTPEHPVLRVKLKKGKGANYWNFVYSKPEWIKAKELEKDDLVMYPILKETFDRNTVNISDFVNVKVKGKYAHNLRETFTARRIPNKIPIDKDFLLLVGYYLAEGCTTNRGINWYFTKKEDQYIADVNRIIKKIFEIEPTNRNRDNIRRIMVFSKILRDLFKALFGTYAHKKQLPHWMLLLPAEKQVEIIRGLWRGDGCTRKKDFTLVTSSRKLAYQVRDLLLRQGIIPQIQKRLKANLNKKPSFGHRKVYFKHDKYHIVVGGAYLKKMSEVLGMEHPKIKHRKHICTHAWIRDGYAMLPIRGISVKRYKGKIYNLAIDRNNTYIAKNFVVHNCDGPLFKDKIVGVVGGSDSAAKEALFLAEHAKKVYIIYRKEKIRAEPINAERVGKNSKIEIINNTNVVEIKGAKFVEKVIFDKPYNGSNEFPLDGLFIEIGAIPATELAVKLGVKVNEKKEILIGRGSKTNVPGVYAAGDITESPFKQVITGVAEGVEAAFSAFEHVKKEK